ncbi:MAG: metal-dependent hydrolase [Deltaproteobacteria bacterium]|nr:metal-dependent hydrolase [Deltaproteobacteria bacterium]
MDAVTHTVAGLAISRLIPAPVRKWGLVLGAAFALLPDIDFLWLFFDRLAYIRYHRGVTHSLLALGVFAGLGALLARRWGGPRWFKPVLALGLAVLASHMLLDLATSYGTQILSPFSRQKFALDWIFIIDPYLTFLLLIGSAGGLVSPARGRLLAALSLSAAAVYFLLCGFYHNQAMILSRQVFSDSPTADLQVAALPQPLSCRRWHLLCYGPAEVKQTMVQLPRLGIRGASQEVKVREDTWAPGLNPHAPPLAYQPPESLVVQTWQITRPPPLAYASDSAAVLKTFLEFARFPLLYRWEPRDNAVSMQFLDLRFTIPGRAFPFVLELSVSNDGRLQNWRWGRSYLNKF